MDLSLLRQIRHFGSSITVLYVEDEQNVRDQIKKMLTKLFEKVDVAVDGSEAFEMYKHARYDLVITDLKMPKMDGLEFCQKIIASDKEQKILLVSAHKDIDEVLTLVNLGISGFLTKPIDMDEMLEKLYTISKSIYSNSMMKIHNEEMRLKLLQNTTHSEEELHYRDRLTSLYNQDYFLKCIQDDSRKIAILVDINDFKLINDYYSFAHGNHLLFQIAEVLKKRAEFYGYELFRLANNEFVLLKREFLGSCEEIEVEARNIYETLERERYEIVGANDISLGVTMGIAKSKNNLLENLYRALTHAKKHGLHLALYRDAEDNRESVKNIIDIKKLLKKSIEKSTIIPVYQPILMQDKSIKYEVLMRIKPLDGSELITPITFLDIAKRHKYYNEISQMVILKALKEMRSHQEVFSINISYADMKNEKLTQMLETSIEEGGLGKRLVFEIVESDYLENIDVAIAFIERFRAYGVKIAIDDFGSGYSNFAHIFLLHPDIVKIDGSLIQQMLHNKNISLFVETIITFAHKLEIEVVAEFVSSKELYDALRALCVDGYQGYFIGYPKEVINEDS